MSAPLSLLVMSRAGVFTSPLPETGQVVVGRGEECDLRLDDTKASRRHAVFKVEDGAVSIQDFGSTNGTLVGEKRVESGGSVTLTLGDMVTIGATVLVLQSAQKGAAPSRLWSKDAFLSRLDEERRRPGSRFAVVQVRLEAGTLLDPTTSTSTKSALANDVARAEFLEATLRGALRAKDVVASYATGAYEVLLPEALPDVAEQLAAQVRARLSQEGFRAEVGVACYPRDAESEQGLVAKANERSVVEPPAPVLDEGPMKRLEPVIERVAAGHINVLILGETGVGKEVLARRIHERSPRAAAPLVAINCAALSSTLLESELFGYEKGAFTGATQSKQGLLEAAQGGTVFLDEIGEMPIELQAKLLRVLEQREVMRIGSLKPRPLDVRFLSATNRDLEAEIESGRFRQDLYFRLNVISVTIPPLRARVDEIEELANGFLAGACERAGRKNVPVLSPQVLAVMKKYAWPGNIRELRNMMERALVLCAGDTITVEHLPPGKPVMLGEAPRPARATLLDAAETSPDLTALKEHVKEQERIVERQKIMQALEKCAGNQTQAAKLLGISRRTLVTRIEEFGLPRPRKRTDLED